MKRLMLLLVFCSSILSYGQESYEIKVSNLNYRINKGVKNKTSSNINIKVHYVDGSEESIYRRDINNEGDKEVNKDIDAIIRYKRPTKISCYAFVNFRTGTDAGGTENVNISTGCSEGFFDESYSPRMTSISFNYSIEPMFFLLQQNNTLIGFEDDFDVSVSANSTGFISSLYKWEYKAISTGVPGTYGWTDMPYFTTYGKSSFSIKPSSFLDEDDIGKRIYFRITPCNSYVSNTIYYRLTTSAPHFTNVIDPNEPLCYNGNDGSVKFNFDRDLFSGEKLSISVTNTNGEDFSEENIEVDYINRSYFLDKLPPGTYEAQLLGFGVPAYNGAIWNTFVEDADHSTTFIIKNPSPVEFSYEKEDVWCHGGNDGKITVTATGGTDSYQYLFNGASSWLPFSNGDTHTFSSLTPNATYKLKVRDSNGCNAREPKIVNGVTEYNEKEEEQIQIIQPNAPLSNIFVYSEQPKAKGFSNGLIRAEITGGTPLTNGSYNFTWTHENGTSWTTFDTELTDGNYYVTLKNAIAGKYKLTIKDLNYNNAKDKAGCTVINAEFTLLEPEALTLRIQKTNAISCNNTNAFNDESSDGELTAIANGGVKLGNLRNGENYIYTWKKKDNSGVYQTITGETASVLSGIDAGEYAVNIEDANGIIVGTYVNNILQNQSDVTNNLLQPNLLEINLSKTDVFCNGGNDGRINATITGGTGNNYTIHWNNGKETEDINTLVAGIYEIKVTDEKGCQAEASIEITEPQEPLEISYTFFEPTFAGATNGWVEATITGGTALNTGAYTYQWIDSNNASMNTKVTEIIGASSYIIRLNGIGKDIYRLTVQDKNYAQATNKTSCYIDNSEFELNEPEPLVANIELGKPISCNSNNIYGEPYSDGALKVIVTGGVRLQTADNNGLFYYYTWKKETSAGIWTVLPSQTSDIATGLDSGNYAVNIEDANGIIIGTYENDMLVSPSDIIYNFEEPELLKISFEKQDVYCYEGSDAWASIDIEGGITPYTIKWSTGSSIDTITELPKGIYDVLVTDARGCTVEGSVIINEPVNPITINYTAFATPSTAGASDGWIEASIAGGTDFTNNSYTYFWQDGLGKLLNLQTTATIVNGIFLIRLNNIPKGNYYLTIEDANFEEATTKEGCTFLEEEFILYDPIEATINIQTPISCNQENVYDDPFSNGALEVSVTGGLPFDNGAPYIYTWKKENDNGIFEDINQNTAIAKDLSDGNYALNVEDSRGVIIGVYNSNTLINATDVKFYFEEPELLSVKITSTEISCDAGNDATAKVIVSGGIAPYDIQWSNGDTTETAVNLISGNFIVYVTDARGCQITGNVFIGQPGGLSIEILEEIAPTCYGVGNGQISLELSGGVAPYIYSWDTGETTTYLNNLSEGTYLFELEDANGCKAFSEIKLKYPEEIIIDLGQDRTLCKGQSHFLDATIDDENTTYEWISENGFSANTSEVEITEAGTYKVIATTSLGCISTDSVIISYNDVVIDAEFLLSSQAYVDQDVVVLNVSDPIGDTFSWDIPETVSILEKTDKTLTLRFPKIGSYRLGLTTLVGDCYQGIYKNIVVEESSNLADPGDAKAPFIEQIIVSPNPNDGKFLMYAKLAETSAVAIRVFNNLGQSVYTMPNMSMSDEYSISMELNLVDGFYFIVVETAKETQIVNMVVK